MKRVLVVDDSPSVRALLAHVLGSDPELDVVGCAHDGEQAVRMAQEKKPDVITMDLHMPNMNGFDATRKIMQVWPVPIVIVSGSDDRNEMGVSFRAIEAGALVIVQRPFGPGHPAHEATAQELIRTVKSMAEVKVVRRWPKRDGTRQPGSATRSASLSRPPRRLVAVGASTGGPAVIRDILAELPSDYPLPVVIVQHMTAGFLEGFADWLTTASGFAVGIAHDGEYLAGGRAYLAPDGFQIEIGSDLRVALVQAKPEHGMCPSVSYLFRSIHRDLCPSTVAVLLTGMGKDGAQELKQLKEHGAITIVQDRGSSVVYGMPGEAVRQDAAKLILGPVEIGKTLRSLGQDLHTDITFLGI